MIVVIDGYNLLKQIFSHIKGHLERERDMFVRQLGYYKNQKSGEIKEIIVVFDAGPFSHATREVKHGVVVMFSGQKSTADDWIIEYAEKHRNEELLIVSNDREIISASQRFNATTLSSKDFYRIMQSVLVVDQTASNTPEITLLSGINKFKQSDYFDEELEGLGVFDEKMVDMLMEQSSVNAKKLDDNTDLPKNKSKSDELSKKDKRLFSKLKKLYLI